MYVANGGGTPTNPSPVPVSNAANNSLSVVVGNATGSPIPAAGTVNVGNTAPIPVSGNLTVDNSNNPFSVIVGNAAGSPLPVSGNVTVSSLPTVTGSVTVTNPTGGSLKVTDDQTIVVNDSQSIGPAGRSMSRVNDDCSFVSADVIGAVDVGKPGRRGGAA